MKFLVDECCSSDLVLKLRNGGHDVIYVMEFKPSSSDKEVLDKAYSEKRILITEDKDFGELVFRLKKPACGIILLRFGISDRNLKWPRIKKLIEIKSENLKDKFVVVDKDKIRLLDLIYPSE